MSARDKDLIGSDWTTLEKDDLQYVRGSDTVHIGGNGRVQWTAQQRRQLVMISLFGALAHADRWALLRPEAVQQYGVWKRPSHIIEGDVDYPVFDQLLTSRLAVESYGAWQDQFCPRLRNQMRALIHFLQADCDFRVGLLYPEVNHGWREGIRVWLSRKELRFDLLQAHPVGADPTDYLMDAHGYVDGHPERISRARKKGVKVTSLLANAWNALEGLERLTPKQIMQQYEQ